MTTHPSVSASLEHLQQEERLPASYLSNALPYLLTCAQYLALKHHQKDSGALIWGICGSQGSGKSTLVRFLATLLEERYGLRAVTLSLDDFYLDQEARNALASATHPLFATRGVPGTHDVELGISTLLALQKGELPQLPAFDKSIDNPKPRAAWHRPEAPADVVLFEGWCVASQAQQDDQLDAPTNRLEQDEDARGDWRRHVNACLQGPYAHWWSLLDGLLFLQAPSFEQVYDWRRLQESKLRDQFEQQGKPLPPGVMDEPRLARFIQHYERLTRWNLKTLPERADLVIALGADHQFAQLTLHADQWGRS